MADFDVGKDFFHHLMHTKDLTWNMKKVVNKMILLFGMAQLLASLFKCRGCVEVYIMFEADQGPFAAIVV